MKKLLTSIAVAAAVTATSLPVSFDVQAVGFQEQKKRAKRPTNLVGPSVGKKVQKAFEAYTAEDIDGAIEILKAIKTKKDYDTAYVNRFIANMLAQKGKNLEAIDYLNKAIAPDILNEPEQADSLKLVAQLESQERKYADSIKHFKMWMDFTGKEDPMIWVRIGQAYMELKQLDKMIEPADKAIALYKAQGKPNQNPYILKVTSYYERKQYKNAVTVLEEIVQVFPENKQWWVQLGSFYSLIEDYKNAMYTLDVAYKQGYLEKDNQIKMLASMYAANDVPYKAAKLIEKYIDSGLIARDEKSIAMLANYWHSSQEIIKAAKSYGELAKLSNEAKHYRKQGGLLLQAEKYSQCIAPLKKALDLDIKDKGRVYTNLMEAYFYQGKYKQSLAMNKEAMKFPKSKRNAKAWTQYIIDKANRKGVKI